MQILYVHIQYRVGETILETAFLVQKEYGHIVLHLRKLMDERKIKRNQLAVAAGVNYPVIDRWYKGAVERIDVDVLARICYVLDCQVQDILTYEKD